MFKCLKWPKAVKWMLLPVRDTLALELFGKCLKTELGRGFGKIFFPHMSIYISSFASGASFAVSTQSSVCINKLA